VLPSAQAALDVSRCNLLMNCSPLHYHPISKTNTNGITRLQQVQFGTTTSGVANFKLFHYTTFLWATQIYTVCPPTEVHTQNTTWCFSDRASCIDYILITNLMYWLLFIHKNTILLYMFRASSAHLQEDTVVYMQHMALSLCKQVSGLALLKHDLLVITI